MSVTACAVQLPEEPADLYIDVTQDGDDFIFTVTGERADEVEAGAIESADEDIGFFVRTEGASAAFITQEAAEDDGEKVFAQSFDVVGETTIYFELFDYVEDENALISVNGGQTTREARVPLPVRSPSMQSGLHATCIRRRCRLAA